MIPEQEYDLYGGTPPHQQTDTSLDAALAVEPLVNGLQVGVLSYFRQCGERGSTDDEMLVTFHALHPNTLAPRRRELVLKGFLEASAERRVTRWGKKAIVWKVVEAVE